MKRIYPAAVLALGLSLVATSAMACGPDGCGKDKDGKATCCCDKDGKMAGHGMHDGKGDKAPAKPDGKTPAPQDEHKH